MIIVDNDYIKKMLEDKETRKEFSHGKYVFSMWNEDIEFELSGWNIRNFYDDYSFVVENMLDIHFVVRTLTDEQVEVEVDKAMYVCLLSIINEDLQYFDTEDNYNDLYDDDEPDGCAQYHAKIDN